MQIRSAPLPDFSLRNVFARAFSVSLFPFVLSLSPSVALFAFHFYFVGRKKLFTGRRISPRYSLLAKSFSLMVQFGLGVEGGEVKCKVAVGRARFRVLRTGAYSPPKRDEMLHNKNSTNRAGLGGVVAAAAAAARNGRLEIFWGRRNKKLAWGRGRERGERLRWIGQG